MAENDSTRDDDIEKNSFLHMIGFSIVNPMRLKSAIEKSTGTEEELNRLFAKSFLIPIILGLNAAILVLLSSWGNNLSGLMYTDLFWSTDLEYSVLMIPIGVLGGFLLNIIFTVLNLLINKAWKQRNEFRRQFILTSSFLAPTIISLSVGFFAFPSAGIWHFEDFPLLILTLVLIGLTLIYWIVFQNFVLAYELEKPQAIIRFAVGVILNLSPIIVVVIVLF